MHLSLIKHRDTEAQSNTVFLFDLKHIKHSYQKISLCLNFSVFKLSVFMFERNRSRGHCGEKYFKPTFKDSNQFINTRYFILFKKTFNCL